MYIKETCIVNGIYEIDKYCRPRSYQKGESRGKKAKLTSEAQKKVNQRHAKKKKQRIIRANFTKDDLFLTFTYAEGNRPQTKEEARLDRKALMDGIRKAMQKRGIRFSYVAVTEIGVKGGVHHHLLVKKCDTEIFTRVWKKGGINFKYIYSEDLDRLAKYLSGDDESEERKKHECVYEFWSHSKDLVIPEVKRERISSRSFIKIPKVRRGYILTDLRQGINSWGYEWQSYKLVPIERERRDDNSGIMQEIPKKHNRTSAKPKKGEQQQRKFSETSCRKQKAKT